MSADTKRDVPTRTRPANRPDGAESKIDEALEETFPASDPPANTPVMGVGHSPAPSPVVDCRERNRFELAVDGEIAHLDYAREEGNLVLVHTEVPHSLRGRGLGNVLVEAALDDARREGLRIVALCPFVRAYLKKHPRRV